jgi:ribosomal protein S18 acetylase RimI-like enzyme
VKRGYGTALMQASGREAVARGCKQLVLDTRSFQAPLFYQRLGFEIVGGHSDYARGQQNLYLRKSPLK